MADFREFSPENWRHRDHTNGEGDGQNHQVATVPAICLNRGSQDELADSSTRVAAGVNDTSDCRRRFLVFDLTPEVSRCRRIYLINAPQEEAEHEKHYSKGTARQFLIIEGDEEAEHAADTHS